MATEHDPPNMALHCPICDSTAVCEPRGHIVYDEPSEGTPERYTLMRCPRGHALLVFQEDFGPGQRFDDDDPFRLYPPQDRPLSDEIPDELRAAHEEARRCFRAKAWTGTVAMCGRTLEGACKVQGVMERDLRRNLAKMKDLGLIDGRLWEWAETLRGVRNAAAHFNDETVSRQDAEDALAYSEALLDYLYVLTTRFEAMKARRTAEA